MVFRAGEIVLGLATLVLMPSAVLAQGSPVPGSSSYSAQPNSFGVVHLCSSASSWGGSQSIFWGRRCCCKGSGVWQKQLFEIAA
jgi:hypothetical protein